MATPDITHGHSHDPPSRIMAIYTGREDKSINTSPSLARRGSGRRKHISREDAIEEDETLDNTLTDHLDSRYIEIRNSKQPIRTRYLGHVTGYQPIRDQYFLIFTGF